MITHKIIHNPDKLKIFPTWYYCRKCFKSYTVGQAHVQIINKRTCCSKNLRGVSTGEDFKAVAVLNQ